MGTLGGLFNLSKSTLQADQAAITATASNISNQNTDGYAKRVVSFTENDTVQISGYALGNGTTAAVTANRDTVLDRNVQTATASAGSGSARYSALQNLQSVFTVSSTGDDSSGISTAINSFFTSVSSLSSDPTSASARQATLSAAQTVASTFNQASAQITSQTASLNGTVTTSVSQVNDLLTSIAKTNGEIQNQSSTGEVSTLVDQRTSLITQLSALIGVQQTTTENNGLNLSTSNGTLLVAGSSAYALGTSNVGGNTHVVANAKAGGADLTSTLSGGSIGGTIQARDTDLPAVQTQLDTLAYSFAAAINTQNAAGLDANGTAGTAVFSIGASSSGAAAAISVSLASASGLAAAATTEGTGGNGNANSMLALQTSNTVGGQTFSGNYSSMISALGTTVSSAKAASTSATAIQTQATTQQDAYSGVSLDEEASNLTQYQRSYQAAAKLMSILNEIMASAINLGTETSVS